MATAAELREEQKRLEKSFIDSQPATQQAIKQEQGYDDKNKTLQGIRKSIYDTEKIVSSLPEDIKRRTGGMLVTSSQANRIRAKEQDPLVRQLGDLSRSEQVESSGLSNIEKMIADRLNINRENFNIQNRGLEGEISRLAQEEADARNARLAASMAYAGGYGNGGAGGDGYGGGGGGAAEEMVTFEDSPDNLLTKINNQVQVDRFGGDAARRSYTDLENIVSKTPAAQQKLNNLFGGTTMDRNQMNANRAKQGLPPLSAQDIATINNNRKVRGLPPI